jgi:signal transduction histidine kinase
VTPHERGASRSFSARAIAGFTAALLVTSLLVATALHALQTQGAAARALAAADEQLMEATRLDLTAEEMVAGARGYLLTSDARRLQLTQSVAQRFGDEIRVLSREARPSEVARQLDRVARAADAYRAAFSVLSARSGSPPDATSAKQAEATLLEARAVLKDSLSAFVTERGAQAAESGVQAERARRRAVAVVLSLGAVGIIVSGLVAWITVGQLRRSYDRERGAARAAEEALEARSRLLEVIAHDLRSPLSAVTLSATLIRRAGRDPGDVKRATSIERVAARMERLLADLLDVGALETGGLTVRPVPCAVGPVISEVITSTRLLAEEKSIRLDEEVEPGLEVRADPQRLAQVLANLVGNAVKFTPPDGRVLARVFRVGDVVRVAVTDTGPGIPDELQSHVFERRWRGDPAGASGAGLGLYIAKAIVDAHGGQLWLESKVGVGSTFYCDLPIWREALGEARPTVARAAPGLRAAEAPRP